MTAANSAAANRLRCFSCCMGVFREVAASDVTAALARAGRPAEPPPNGFALYRCTVCDATAVRRRPLDGAPS